MEAKNSGGPTSPNGGGRGGGSIGVVGGRGGHMQAKPSSTGSATVVEDKAAAKEGEGGVLRLRLHPRPHVKWDEKVIDNEHMNKKSSKRCCIFHKKRAFGESSSESESESDDGDEEKGGERGEMGKAGGRGGKGRKGKKKDKHMHVAQPKHPPIKPHETYHA